MKPTPEYFQAWVERAGLQWEGHYVGRAHHRGYAILLKKQDDLAPVVSAMSRDPKLASLTRQNPHLDNLCDDIIASWEEWLFEKE